MVTLLIVRVPVTVADPSGGRVVARGSIVLLCLAAPSGSLAGFHLPSFAKNLESTTVLQDLFVIVSTHGGELVAICTDSRTGEHLATFTRRPGSGLYTVTTESAQVAALGQVAASGQLAASSSCRLLTYPSLLWHHRLGHPSLPRLRSIHSCLLVSGLSRSLTPLPQSLAPPCLLCVERHQCAAPHSSLFPPTTAPLKTLHMDITRCRQDLPVLRLHSDQGGEFSSHLLEDFCGAERITQTFTILASPQQNEIAERRIGLFMEVARTSITHVVAPHFLWLFAVRHAAKQLNLWPRVSEVDPPPMVAPLEVSSDTSGPTEGGGPGADDTPAARRPLRLETPLGFLPRLSSPPLQPVAVDSGAARGGDTRGADSEGAGSGGAESPTGGRVVSTPAGDFGSGRQPQPSRQETLLPQQLHEWAVQWGSPGARAWGAGAGGAGAGGPGACRQETLSPQQLREWAVWWGSPGGGAGGAGAGGASAAAVGGAGAGGAGAGGAGDADAGGAGAGGALRTGAEGVGGAGTPSAAIRHPKWHDTQRTTLAALGFAPSTADSSMFLRTDPSLPLFYILVHVDDLVFATADTEALALVKAELQKRHTCTNLGELRSYLGLQITWDRARCTITLTLVTHGAPGPLRFDFHFSSPQSAPLPTGYLLSAPPLDEFVEPSGQYPEIVGSLMYLMTCTRPDLAYPLFLG
ncbi:unnamed protein product [Closterium sp. NIES-53]